MAIHVRQICLVAEELEPVVRQIENLFDIAVCHRDPAVEAFGLENALFAFGNQFLEVVAPIREGTAAGRFLERRGGAGGYMVICQATSLDVQADVRARAADNNVRVAHETNYGSWNIMQLHPRDMGAAFLEVDWDEQADPQGNWQPAGGTDWVQYARPDRVAGIAGVTLSDPEPVPLARRWSAVLGLPVTESGAAPVIQTPNVALRFARGEAASAGSLSALEVVVSNPAEVLARAADLGLAHTDHSLTLCGVDITLSKAL